ncbi:MULTISPECIES: hypothetical protein [unclassified Pseudomonas]|uniref:hypothetical protein n=1 Tax=unclassified Pseudomonas TaxID=196821 RepID=UPI001C61012A|nr:MULTISPECIES: hypothetical protein [unclassified Pseudomonas]MBW5416082.1 hypothetical protein [Pseudomonas sp. MAG002Y]
MKKPHTYTFRIIGSSPNRLPLDRLALYLAELAKLMGENEHIHFDRVVKGSAALRVWAEPEVAPAVSKRISLAIAKSTKAPKEAIYALDHINKLLIHDGKKAELKSPDDTVLYPFHGGKKIKAIKDIIVDDESTVTGRVIKIGGKDDTIPMLLIDSDGVEYHCTIRGEELARDIGLHYLGDPIAVSGKAKWRRSFDGKWTLDQLLVKSWTTLSNDWDDAFAKMTQLATGWREVPDIEEHCAEIRKGH